MKHTVDIIIFSHRVDNDGYLSAALMNEFFPYYIKAKYAQEHMYELYSDDIHIKNVPWTYGDKNPDINIIKRYDYCLVLDIHFDNEMTLALKKHFGDKFIWIEHHALPIFEYCAYCSSLNEDNFVNGIQSVKQQCNNSYINSAAELCWYFLFGCQGTERFGKYDGIFKDIYHRCIDDYKKYKNIPRLVKLVSDYDVWNFPNSDEWNNATYPFQMGSKMAIKNYKDMQIWFHRNEKYIDELIDAGKIIIKYETAECLKDIRIGKIERTFEFNNRTYKACIINTTKRTSSVFMNMPERDEYDVFICYNMIENDDNILQYRYSMYAFKDDVNCAGMIINGLKFNGHNHATGAQSDKFIF